MLVGVDDEQLHAVLADGVVPLVAGEREVVGVRLEAVGLVVVVVAQRGPEPVAGGRAGAVAAGVGVDVVVVPLPHVGVDRVGAAVLVVVVADGGDEGGIPGFDQLRDVARRLD